MPTCVLHGTKKENSGNECFPPIKLDRKTLPPGRRMRPAGGEWQLDFLRRSRHALCENRLLEASPAKIPGKGGRSNRPLRGNYAFRIPPAGFAAAFLAAGFLAAGFLAAAGLAAAFLAAGLAAAFFTAGFFAAGFFAAAGLAAAFLAAGLAAAGFFATAFFAAGFFAAAGLAAAFLAAGLAAAGFFATAFFAAGFFAAGLAAAFLTAGVAAAFFTAGFFAAGVFALVSDVAIFILHKNFRTFTTTHYTPKRPMFQRKTLAAPALYPRLKKPATNF